MMVVVVNRLVSWQPNFSSKFKFVNFASVWMWSWLVSWLIRKWNCRSWCITGGTAGKYDRHQDLNGEHLKDTSVTACWGFIVIFIVLIITIIIIIIPWSRVPLEKLAASQEIPHILWKPVHYRIHRALYPQPDEPSPYAPPQTTTLSAILMLSDAPSAKFFLASVVPNDNSKSQVLWNVFNTGIFYTKKLLTHRSPTLVGFPRLLIQCIRSYPSYL